MQHSLMMLFCSPQQQPPLPPQLKLSLASWKSTYPYYSAGVYHSVLSHGVMLTRSPSYHLQTMIASEMSDVHHHDDHLVATMIYRSSPSFHPRHPRRAR
jgi:hypothetical protein